MRTQIHLTSQDVSEAIRHWLRVRLSSHTKDIKFRIDRYNTFQGATVDVETSEQKHPMFDQDPRGT